MILDYLEVLPKLISSYSSTYHRNIKMVQNQISSLFIGLVSRQLHSNVKSKVRFKFRVHIGKSRRIYRKRYITVGLKTDEVFTNS